MIILFLDFDGVLVGSRFRRRNRHRPDLDRALDPGAVALLDEIIRRAGARVVICSSWREAYDLDELRAILIEHGFTGEVIDVTPKGEERPDGSFPPRGHEIQLWLDAHPVERFVILDDEEDMAHLDPWCVRTDSVAGLLRRDAERVLALFRARA